MSNYFYAQINANGIVIGVSELSGPVEATDMLPINSFMPELIGKQWNGTAFVQADSTEQSATSNYIGTMTVTVNGSSAPRFVGQRNVAASFTVECSPPITDTFAVPLAGLFGAQGKTFIFEFVDGVAEREVVFDASGEWIVTEEQINAHLPAEQRFSFPGLNISIGE